MNPTFRLPTLRSLGELADREPVIIVDTREQTPLSFARLESVRGTLRTGDYSVKGLEDLFSVERKTVADLVGCCMADNRERFERELHRLRGYRFKRLLVVGSEAETWQVIITPTSSQTPCCRPCARSRCGLISRPCLCRPPRPARVSGAVGVSISLARR